MTAKSGKAIYCTLILIFSLALFAVGCARTATFTMADGKSVQVEANSDMVVSYTRGDEKMTMDTKNESTVAALANATVAKALSTDVTVEN